MLVPASESPQKRVRFDTDRERVQEYSNDTPHDLDLDATLALTPSQVDATATAHHYANRERGYQPHPASQEPYSQMQPHFQQQQSRPEEIQPQSVLLPQHLPHPQIQQSHQPLGWQQQDQSCVQLEENQSVEPAKSILKENQPHLTRQRQAGLPHSHSEDSLSRRRSMPVFPPSDESDYMQTFSRAKSETISNYQPLNPEVIINSPSHPKLTSQEYRIQQLRYHQQQIASHSVKSMPNLATPPPTPTPPPMPTPPPTPTPLGEESENQLVNALVNPLSLSLHEHSNRNPTHYQIHRSSVPSSPVTKKKLQFSVPEREYFDSHPKLKPGNLSHTKMSPSERKDVISQFCPTHQRDAKSEKDRSIPQANHASRKNLALRLNSSEKRKNLQSPVSPNQTQSHFDDFFSQLSPTQKRDLKNDFSFQQNSTKDIKKDFYSQMSPTKHSPSQYSPSHPKNVNPTSPQRSNVPFQPLNSMSPNKQKEVDLTHSFDLKTQKKKNIDLSSKGDPRNVLPNGHPHLPPPPQHPHILKPPSNQHHQHQQQHKKHQRSLMENHYSKTTIIRQQQQQQHQQLQRQHASSLQSPSQEIPKGGQQQQQQQQLIKQPGGRRRSLSKENSRKTDKKPLFVEFGTEDEWDSEEGEESLV